MTRKLCGEKRCGRPASSRRRFSICRMECALYPAAVSCLRLPSARAEEGHLVVLAGDAGGVQVFPQPGIQIVTDRDLAHLAALFAEAECPLFAEIAEVAEAQPGDGRRHARENAEHGAIAQAHDMGHIDRAQEFALCLRKTPSRVRFGAAASTV